jgi:hypothetical protein
MAGLALFPPKSALALRPGTKGFASIRPCFFVLNLHKKVQGIAKGPRVILTYARISPCMQQSHQPRANFGQVSNTHSTHHPRASTNLSTPAPRRRSAHVLTYRGGGGLGFQKNNSRCCGPCPFYAPAPVILIIARGEPVAEALMMPFPTQKPSEKHQNLNSAGYTKT